MMKKLYIFSILVLISGFYLNDAFADHQTSLQISGPGEIENSCGPNNTNCSSFIIPTGEIIEFDLHTTGVYNPLDTIKVWIDKDNYQGNTQIFKEFGNAGGSQSPITVNKIAEGNYKILIDSTNFSNGQHIIKIDGIQTRNGSTRTLDGGSGYVVYISSGDPSYISLNTNKSSYSHNESVTVTGEIANHFPDEVVRIQINAPNGPTVYTNSFLANSDGTFSTTFTLDPDVFAKCVVPSENLSDGCEREPLFGIYDLKSFHVAGSFVKWTEFEIIETEQTPDDGPFTLPCSMQEKGDGVSTSSCNGEYQNGKAIAKVGINYHSGLFPITNYKAVGFFIDDEGNQGSNITVTLDKISPDESKELVFVNTLSGFVSEFKMQMLGGELQTIDEDTIPPVIVVPNNIAINATTNNPSPVTFSVSASDDVDGVISPTCSHSSGSQFPIGLTTVTCSASDVAGNSVSKSFTISVIFNGEPVSEPLLDFNFYKFSDSNKQIFFISGNTKYSLNDVNFRVLSPNGNNYVAVNQVTPNSNGDFTTTIEIGPTWAEDGSYDIIVQQTNGQGKKLELIKSVYVVNGIPSIELTRDISITINVNKSSYVDGDNIVISGKVSDILPNTPVSMIVKSPDDKLVSVSQIEINSDRTYSTILTAGGSLMKLSGIYSVIVQYSTDSSMDSTTFYFSSEDDFIAEPSSEITITTSLGSGAPGCEETADGCYLPQIARVSAGGKVIMKNTDSAAHTFTSGTPDGGPDGVFDTSLLMVNGSFEWTPNSEGTYPYFCMVHPWMIGQIIVGEGGPIPLPIKMNLSTDKSIYYFDDKLTYSGSIINGDGSVLVVEIRNPSGVLVYNDRLVPSSNGDFRKSVNLSGDNFEKTGTYSIKALYKTMSKDVSFVLRNQVIQPPINENEFGDNVEVITGPGSGAPGCEENNSCYLPFKALVNRMGTVTWINSDSAAHTITSGDPSNGPNGIFDSSLLMAGGEFSHTFTNTGVYPYFCMVHPWSIGYVIVGQDTAIPQEPEPEEKNIDLEISLDNRVLDINTVATLNISLSGNTEPQNVAISITDPRGVTKISRSVELGVNESTSIGFRIDENFKQGTYKILASTSDGNKRETDSLTFKIKSQFNSFKITSVKVTNQKGEPSDLQPGEIGFIKVTTQSNKPIGSLITVNLFDSELTSIGIGSVQSTLASGESEIILSFMIPEQTSNGDAEIFVNAFTDWPSNGGTPLTKEFSIVENIQWN